MRMKRQCELSDISDGKLYHLEDLVTVSCNGCGGNASCCHGMGNSIVLDPLDLFRIMSEYQSSFEQLMVEKIALNVVDGLVLPNLKMSEETEGCSFLTEKGRCSIHLNRPSICRIFPLGRYYENGSFHYILQTKECHNESQTKVKVQKWIDTKETEKNSKFLIDWHYFLNDVEELLKEMQDENQIRNIKMYILHLFYVKAYEREKDFYEQFYERLDKVKEAIK